MVTSHLIWKKKKGRRHGESCFLARRRLLGGPDGGIGAVISTCQFQLALVSRLYTSRLYFSSDVQRLWRSLLTLLLPIPLLFLSSVKGFRGNARIQSRAPANRSAKDVSTRTLLGKKGSRRKNCSKIARSLNNGTLS